MIEIANLSRHFGALKAVDDITFEIAPGEIVGFLGPNGAGKTTTMRMMVGYLQPSSGSIKINGENIFTNPIKTSQIVGYLPESNPLYTDMRVSDFLAFIGALRKIKGAHYRQRLEYVVENCGLQGVMHQKIGTLSKGYKQRTGLAQAILHDPQVLIMDEPTSGLDPNQIVEIRELIRELGKEKTLILSSHIMQEVQALCERLIIISDGKIVANDSQENLVNTYSETQEIRLSIEAESPDLTEISSRIPELTLVSVHSEEHLHKLILLAPKSFDARRSLAQLCAQKGWLILEIMAHKGSLEDIFFDLTRTGAPAPRQAESEAPAEEIAEVPAAEEPTSPSPEEDSHER